MLLDQHAPEENMWAELPAFPTSFTKQGTEGDTIQRFIDSFEGVYLYAGRDERKQIQYTVRQVMKLEGLLQESEGDNRLVDMLTDMILADSDMKESALMVIQRYGR